MRKKTMQFFESLLRFFDSKMPQPQPYGLFHLAWFAASILVGILLCATHKKGDGQRVRRTVLITAIVVTLLEIYKQINYSFSYEDGISFSYQWYIFPWQFCSTPMYVGLIAGLTKKGFLHRAANAYLATYALFAGAAVMFLPTSVFIETIGINIQTMVCHGGMVVMAVLLLASGTVKLEWRTLKKAVPVFVAMVSAAVLMNEAAYRTGLLEEHTFNMFFISPYCDPSLPVYSLVQAVLPFPWSLVVYVLGFTAAAGIMLALAMGIGKLVGRTRKVSAKRIRMFAMR
jgi:hypothetical protein